MPGKTSARVPTEKQYDRLMMMGNGAAWLSATKGKCDPLLQHGWVTAEWSPPFYQWVRITPDGLRALALAVEKYGLRSLAPERRVKVCAVCEREWKPRCRCGSTSWHFDTKEVQ
jgi:hypothetical protein